MKLSKHLNILMASAVSVSLAASPIGVMPSYAQNAPAAEAPSDAGWQKEFQLWRSVSKSGKTADYQSYLKAYPAGKFASVAKQRIDSLNGVVTTDAAKPADYVTAAKQTAVAADDQAADAKPVMAADAVDADAEKKRDLELWRQVSKTGKQADYEKYLKAFPKGKFAKIAKTRIEGLIAAATPPAADALDTEAAQADEATQPNDQGQQEQAQAQDQSQDQGQDQAQHQSAPADDAGQQDQAQQQNQAAAQADDAQPQEQAKAPAGDWEQEYALWKAASDGNTVKEYEAYLSTYPNGKFAAIAQARIVQLAAAEQPADNVAEGDEQPVDQQANTAKQPEDNSQAQAQDQNQDQSQDQAQDQNQPQADDQSNQTDQANQTDPNQDPNQAQADDQSQMAANQQDNQNQNDMGQNAQPDQNIQYTEGTPETEDEFLNRESRHEMQGRLTSLGYDTFGSDGSFGPNSRTAISNWQTDNGAPVSGYLSGDQIAQIRKLSQVAYANWLNSQQAVVEQQVVRPRREKIVVIEERPNPALDAAIAVGVLGAVVGAHRVGRYKVGRARPGRVQVIGKFKFGKVNKYGCRKKRRC
jgi:colicin import membrane protein